MIAEISDPNRYPSGLLSILYRENGNSIAEDAVKAAAHPTLKFTMPIFDDITYFEVVLNNFENAVENYVLRHASAAAVFRIKKFFLDDLADVREFNVKEHSVYSQAIANLIVSPIDFVSKTVVDTDELARVIEAVLCELDEGRDVQEGTFAELLFRYAHLPKVPIGLGNLRLVTDINKIVQQLKEHHAEQTRIVLVKKIKETLLNKQMDVILKTQYPWIQEKDYNKAKQEQLLRNYTGHLENKLFTMWLNGHFQDYVTDLSQEQIDHVMSRETRTDARGDHIDRNTLAFVVESTMNDLQKLVYIPDLSWDELKDRYFAANQIYTPLRPTAASQLHLVSIVDVDNIVETMRRLTFEERQKTLIKRVKEQLMQVYSGNMARLSHKASLAFKNYKGDVDCRLFQMWRDGLIHLDIANVAPETVKELMGHKKSTQPFTMLFTDLSDDKFTELSRFFEAKPRLRIDYKHSFVYDGGFYKTPLEYGYRKALALFDPVLSVKTQTHALPAVLSKYSVIKFKKNLRTAISTLFWHKCQEPHFWVLFRGWRRLMWTHHASFVGSEWLTSMYKHAMQALKRPSSLDKPPDTCDLTVDPMIKAWFLQRIAMWKNVSIRHKDLFQSMTAKFKTGLVRFPTSNEKRYLEGCEADVWQVIFTEFTMSFGGSKELVYVGIIREITERLPVAPSINNLCKFFKPIYDVDNRGFSSEEELVKDVIGNYNNFTLLRLWTRFFLK